MLPRRQGCIVCVKFCIARLPKYFLLLKSGGDTAHGGGTVPLQKASLASTGTNFSACPVCSGTQFLFQGSSVAKWLPFLFIPEYRALQHSYTPLSTLNGVWTATRQGTCSKGRLITSPKFCVVAFKKAMCIAAACLLLLAKRNFCVKTSTHCRVHGAVATSEQVPKDGLILTSCIYRQTDEVRSHRHLPVHDRVSAILRLHKHASKIKAATFFDAWCQAYT